MGALRVVILTGYEGDGWISIERYQNELMRCLKGLPMDVPLELIPVAPRPGALLDWVSSAGVPGRKLASYASRFLIYPRQIPRVPGAVYHIVNQTLSYLLPYLDPARTVVTCHDLLHFPLWEGMRRNYVWPWASDRLYRYCVRNLPRCARVIAVSQRNKEDAVKYLGCDPGRIRVVHEGVSPAFFRPVPAEELDRFRKAWNLPLGPLLLHVGLPTFYKNIEGVIRALALLRPQFPGVTLVHAGPALTPAQYQLAVSLGVGDSIRELGIQGDDTLPAIYSLADCLVFPSHYEGFGFPPLEAMACGLPVVTSDRGSLPEVAGDAALFVNPDDANAIAAATRRVLEEPDLREQMRARGLEHARRFRWERCAEETLEVYRSLATAE